MTKKEMTKLFSVMLLAWPNAEIFRGGMGKLAPTIQLWTACAEDIDFWTGQQAVYRLCKTGRFPPTIAEFREQADKINAEIQSAADLTAFEIRGAGTPDGSLEDYYRHLPQESFTRAVIDAMGGPGALLSGAGRAPMWDTQGIEAACRAVIRRRPAVIGGRLPAAEA